MPAYGAPFASFLSGSPHSWLGGSPHSWLGGSPHSWLGGSLQDRIRAVASRSMVVQALKATRTPYMAPRSNYSVDLTYVNKKQVNRQFGRSQPYTYRSPYAATASASRRPGFILRNPGATAGAAAAALLIPGVGPLIGLGILGVAAARGVRKGGPPKKPYLVSGKPKKRPFPVTPEQIRQAIRNAAGPGAAVTTPYSPSTTATIDPFTQPASIDPASDPSLDPGAMAPEPAGFPWLPVIGGVLLLGAVGYLATRKKRTSTATHRYHSAPVRSATQAA